MKYRRKVTDPIEAIRYQSERDGAVKEIAEFIAEGELPNEASILDFVRSAGVWSPPEHAALQIFDGVIHHDWLPLADGDWVIRGLKGEVYPCAHEVFEMSYEISYAPVEPGTIHVDVWKKLADGQIFGFAVFKTEGDPESRNSDELIEALRDTIAQYDAHKAEQRGERPSGLVVP